MMALRLLLACAGGFWGLLVARLLFRLLAARPDHPVVAGVLGLTAPARALLAWLDAGQPAFGAVLELSTVVLVLVGGLVLLALRFWVARRYA